MALHKFVSLHIIFPIRPYYSYEKENFPSGFSQTLQTGADSHSRYRVTFRILLFCSLPHWLSVGGSDFFLQRRYVPQPRISLWSLASGLWHRCGRIFPAAFFLAKKETTLVYGRYHIAFFFRSILRRYYNITKRYLLFHFLFSFGVVSVAKKRINKYK